MIQIFQWERDWDTGKAGNNDFRLPVCFLIDGSGKVIFVGHHSSKDLETLIENIFAKK